MGFLDSVKSRLGIEDRNRFRDDEEYYEDDVEYGSDYDYYDQEDEGSYVYDAGATSTDLYAGDVQPDYSPRSGGVKVVPRAASSYRSDSSDWRSPRLDGAYPSSYSTAQPEFMSHRGSDSHHQTVSLRDAGEGGRDSYGELLSSPRSMSSHSKLKIIKPSSYADAEGITASFKVGVNVALQLSSVRSELAKRILDFSFGVVSALGGTVEKVGEKVFLLSHSSTGVTADETRQMRDAGIIK